MITKKVIVTLSRRRAGRHAVKPCGTQEKASAGLAWGGVFGSVRAMALTGVWAANWAVSHFQVSIYRIASFTPACIGF